MGRLVYGHYDRGEPKKENPKIVALQPLKLAEHEYNSEQHPDKIFRLLVPVFLIGSTSNYFQIKSV